jgi:hypothetical protein
MGLCKVKPNRTILCVVILLLAAIFLSVQPHMISIKGPHREGVVFGAAHSGSVREFAAVSYESIPAAYRGNGRAGWPNEPAQAVFYVVSFVFASLNRYCERRLKQSAGIVPSIVVNPISGELARSLGSNAPPSIF